jgi:uncharacterized protein (DUF433 family)
MLTSGPILKYEASGPDTSRASYHRGVANEDLLERISVDPAVSFGKTRVRGTCIWVGLVLALMADGMSHEEILAEYPQLSEDDLRACLAYGARLTAGHFVDIA